VDYVKIQMEKNFSTGNINIISDTNESSVDNDYSFSINDEINSLSSYEAEYVNPINNNNHNHLSPKNHPKTMFSLDNSSTSSCEKQINESDTYFEKEDPKNKNENISKNNNKLNIQRNTISDNNKSQNYNHKDNNNDIKLNNKNKININNNNNILNENISNDNKYPSLLLKKNNLIQKELKGITGSYSSLLYNELTKSLINHKIDTIGSVDNINSISDNDSSTFSPESPHSPQSLESSLNSSSISLNQINDKITSPSADFTTSPLSYENNSESNKISSDSNNKHGKNNRNK